MTNPRPTMSRMTMHEHSGSLHDLLAILEKELRASSLMTPWAQVASITAPGNGPESKATALKLMNAHHYSGVPVVWEGAVCGMYLRHAPDSSAQYEGIRPNHFVAADLSLIRLIRHMRDAGRIAVGVGTPESPLGWLTYADFSKRPFRVLLFAVVAEVECLLAHALDTAYPDDSWVDLIPVDPVSQRNTADELRKRQSEAQGYDVTMPITTFADIGHLVRGLPQATAALALLGESADIASSLLAISDLRNRVAHVVRPVVPGPKHIGPVANQLDLLLGWIDTWSARMSATASDGRMK
jgi:hypothetical protein